MAFDKEELAEITATMNRYIEAMRPPPEIRPDLDLGYEIDNQSIILHEIRPAWRNPEETLKIGYARVTFVRRKCVWKVYWKRADRKWHVYTPKPTVKRLKDFISLVDEDRHGCFKG